MNAKSARWLYQDDGPDPDPLDPEPLACNAETLPWGGVSHHDCDPMTCAGAAFDIFDEAHDYQNGLHEAIGRW